MTDLAPILQGFFTDRLTRQKNASPHTVAAYRDTCRLLLAFAQQQTGRSRRARLRRRRPGRHRWSARSCTTWKPSEATRSATRNARLAAIHSLFRYAALRAPEHAELISQVLAIPPRRRDRAIVSFLTAAEIDALLAAPDRATWLGRRDHALLLLAVQTGLRVSELTGLTRHDIHLGAGAARPLPRQRPQGPGHPAHQPDRRRARSLARRTRPAPPTARCSPPGPDAGCPETPSSGWSPNTPPPPRRAARRISDKNVTPHTLRHTAAMSLLRAGVDTSVIALWLGHEDAETTQIYLHADMTIKEQALARVQPPGTSPGRYRPPDTLLAFLENL